MYRLMFLFLILGYLMFLTYLVIMITNKCLCIIVVEPSVRNSMQNYTNPLLKAISSELFTPEEFVHENRCIICITDFVANKDMVTRLPCDERHYFHTSCLSRWI